MRRAIEVTSVTSSLQLPPEELTRLLVSLSRRELLERFGGQSS
jgi:DNA-binding IclR family transcriptional regulator